MANSRNRRPTMSPMKRMGMNTAMSEKLIDSTVKPTSWALVSAAGGGRLGAGAAGGGHAGGLSARPGLAARPPPLGGPGREDPEPAEPGRRAAALGASPAGHAMANTGPVADTAGVVEQVWRL